MFAGGFTGWTPSANETGSDGQTAGADGNGPARTTVPVIVDARGQSVNWRKNRWLNTVHSTALADMCKAQNIPFTRNGCSQLEMLLAIRPVLQKILVVVTQQEAVLEFARIINGTEVVFRQFKLPSGLENGTVEQLIKIFDAFKNLLFPGIGTTTYQRETGAFFAMEITLPPVPFAGETTPVEMLLAEYAPERCSEVLMNDSRVQAAFWRQMEEQLNRLEAEGAGQANAGNQNQAWQPVNRATINGNIWGV